MWITANHLVAPGFDPLKVPFEKKVEIFRAFTDVWFLAVAYQAIEGHQNPDGSEAINLYNPQKEKYEKYLPHAGWAVLHLVMNYFEVIGCFRCGMIKTKKYQSGFNKTRFKDGFKQVIVTLSPYYRQYFFDDLINNEDASDHLWDFRNGLFHAGDIKSPIIISGGYEFSIKYRPDRDVLHINPHRFVPMLGLHLELYVKELLAAKEGSKIRINFERAYNDRYTAKKPN